MGGDLRRRPAGLCRVVPTAAAGTGPRKGGTERQPGVRRRMQCARNEVSAMTNNRTILITGVTGNQGGAVAQALQGAGFHLRGLTRKPDSEQAAALARISHTGWVASQKAGQSRFSTCLGQ